MKKTNREGWPLEPREITIRCGVPRGVPAAELRAFICDALETWGGQRHPDDPVFCSLDSVRVTLRARAKGPGA